MKTKITTLLLLLATLSFGQRCECISTDLLIGPNLTNFEGVGIQIGGNVIITRQRPEKLDIVHGPTLKWVEYTNNQEISRGWMVMYNLGVQNRGGDRFLITGGVISGHRSPITLGVSWNKYIRLTDVVGFVIQPKYMHQFTSFEGVGADILALSFGLSFRR